MFEHRIVNVGGRSVGSMVDKAQEQLDLMSREGWELVAAAEQAPTSLSVRLYFKRPVSSS